MRNVPVVVLILLAATLPVGQGQDSETFAAVVEDNGGNTWHLMGDDPFDDNDYNEGSAVEQDADRPATDLRALYVAEAPNGDLQFRLHLTELPDEEAGCIGAYCFYNYDIEFEMMTYEMSIDIFSGVPICCGDVEWQSGASLRLVHRTENSYRSEYLGEITLIQDPATNTFTTIIPRSMVADPQGRLMQPGTVLSQFAAYSSYTDEATIATFGFASTRDRMPDDFNAYMPNTFETSYGITSSGHLDAFSPLPLRTSNGEATTFLFQVEVTNTGDFIDTVRPSWQGGLDTWTVTFPDGNIRMTPDEKRSIPFLVTVPFAHEHGVYYPFNVTFQSQADPEAAGNIELGVRYTAVPQPAGHHPQVFLHEPGYNAYFNTVRDVTLAPEGEAGQGTGSFTCNFGGGQTQVIPLSPTLSMGLDFNLNEVGTANWVVSSDTNSDGYAIDGYLIVDSQQPDACDISRGDYHPGTVAVINTTGPMTIAGDQLAEYSAEITPTEFGDYVAFDETNQLWLAIRMPYQGSGNDPTPFNCNGCDPDSFTQPEWVEGSSLILPLNEYHDDVDDYFAELSGIDLFAANNSQERFVNPGETIIYRIDATNVGVQQAVFNLEITGTNTEWATLLGDISEIKLKPGETRELALAVRAPGSGFTSDGEIADIVLHATLAEDESIRSIIRLVTEVDTDEDHPDETSAVTGVDEALQNAPSPFLPVLLLLLVGAALVRRVRR